MRGYDAVSGMHSKLETTKNWLNKQASINVGKISANVYGHWWASKPPYCARREHKRARQHSIQPCVNSCERSDDREGCPGENTSTVTVTVTVLAVSTVGVAMVESPNIDHLPVMELLNIIGCNGCNNPSYSMFKISVGYIPSPWT